MPKEYIERQASINAVAQDMGPHRTHDFNAGCARAVNRIIEIPAADVVEVVRCRECYFRELDGADVPVCTGAMAYSHTPDDWFCAAGKPKDGGQDDD